MVEESKDKESLKSISGGHYDKSIENAVSLSFTATIETLTPGTGI
jgi:hypothetical protein